MTEPAKKALTEECEDRGQPCAFQHFSVWDLVLPFDSKNSSEAAEMEAVQSLLLGGVCGPPFTTVE